MGADKTCPRVSAERLNRYEFVPPVTVAQTEHPAPPTAMAGDPGAGFGLRLIRAISDMAIESEPGHIRVEMRFAYPHPVRRVEMVCGFPTKFPPMGVAGTVNARA